MSRVEEDTEEDPVTETVTETSVACSWNSGDDWIPDLPTEDAEDSESPVDDDEDDEYEPPKKKRQRKRPSVRISWSREDKKELESLFAPFFQKKTCPRQQDCLRAIAQSKKDNGTIHIRSWDNIKKKVWYMITH